MLGWPVVIFKSKRTCLVSNPKEILEKDCGDIATMTNMTNRTGTDMVAVQIVMHVATKTKALRENTVCRMDC